MIVIDASVVVELVTGNTRYGYILVAAQNAGETVAAPNLIDVEVTQALRRIMRGRPQPHGENGLNPITLLLNLKIVRYPHRGLLHRVWDLRHNLTAYDATYVALAESFDARLLTRDAKLAASRGHEARIELVS